MVRAIPGLAKRHYGPNLALVHRQFLGRRLLKVRYHQTIFPS